MLSLRGESELVAQNCPLQLQLQSETGEGNVAPDTRALCSTDQGVFTAAM